MKVIIIAGKVVFAVIWLGLFAILGGATGELSSQSIGLLSVLLAVLVIMHLLLLGVFVGTMKQHLPWKKGQLANSCVWYFRLVVYSSASKARPRLDTPSSLSIIFSCFTSALFTAGCCSRKLSMAC